MAVIAPLERQTGRLANLEREFRGDEPIGPSANAIRSEEFFRHRFPVLIVRSCALQRL